MDILLIRHLESTKNLRNSFSSDSNSEALSHNGHAEGSRLAADIGAFAQLTGRSVQGVHCSASNRTEYTARLIASEIGTSVLTHVELRSFHVGVLAGSSEQRAAHILPEFMQQLALYRSGLFSSYDLSLPAESEVPRNFERRVMVKLTEIMTEKRDLEILVLTRSVITAVLIAIARSAYGYPDSFYGHVPLDLGRVSWLTSKSGIGWLIRAVNVSSEELLSQGFASTDSGI
jgi:broad specificity phosphatase PhoE